MADDLFVGPINSVVFTFPPGAPIGDGLQVLYAQVVAGTIEILDIEFLRLSEGGAMKVLAASEVGEPGGFDTSVFEGAASGILDDEDHELIAAGLEPGGLAVTVVYEDRTLALTAASWEKVGGQELLSGGVDMVELAEIVQEGQ